MKVFVTIKDTRILVPCRSEDAVNTLIECAITLYKFTTALDDNYPLKITHLKHQDGQLISPTSTIQDVLKENQELIAEILPERKVSSGSMSPIPSIMIQDYLTPGGQTIVTDGRDMIITQDLLNKDSDSNLAVRWISEPDLKDFDMADKPEGSTSTPNDKEKEIFPWNNFEHIMEKINNTSAWSVQLSNDSDSYSNTSLSLPHTSRNISLKSANKKYGNSAVKVVTLKKEAKHPGKALQPFGFDLTFDLTKNDKVYGLKIQGITPGGIAAINGNLKTNNSIIDINGTSLIGLEYAKCKDILNDELKKDPDNIRLSTIPDVAPPIPSCQPPDTAVIKRKASMSSSQRGTPPEPPCRHLSTSLSRKNSAATAAAIVAPTSTPTSAPTSTTTTTTTTTTTHGVASKVATPHTATSLEPSVGVEPSTRISPNRSKIIAPTNTKKIGSLITISLLKGNDGLGFSVTTRDIMDSNQCPIYIKKILPRGAAILDHRLRPGDRLIRINDSDMTNLSQTAAVSLLRDTRVGSTVKLVISRHVTTPTSPTTTTPTTHTIPTTAAIGSTPLRNTTSSAELKHNEKLIVARQQVSPDKTAAVGGITETTPTFKRIPDLPDKMAAEESAKAIIRAAERPSERLSEWSSFNNDLDIMQEVKVRKPRPSSTVGFLHAPAADATTTMTNRTSALLDSDISITSNGGLVTSDSTDDKMSTAKDVGVQDLNDDDSDDNDLSASFTRSFQRNSLARQSMSLKRNKLSNGSNDPRLEKLYAKVKEVRLKEQENQEKQSKNNLNNNNNNDTGNENNNNNKGMSHHSATWHPRTNTRTSNEEPMTKSASLKYKLVRNRGNNNSFRSAVDRSYASTSSGTVLKKSVDKQKSTSPKRASTITPAPAHDNSTALASSRAAAITARKSVDRLRSRSLSKDTVASVSPAAAIRLEDSGGGAGGGGGGGRKRNVSQPNGANHRSDPPAPASSISSRPIPMTEGNTERVIKKSSANYSRPKNPPPPPKEVASRQSSRDRTKPRRSPPPIYDKVIHSRSVPHLTNSHLAEDNTNRYKYNYDIPPRQKPMPLHVNSNSMPRYRDESDYENLDDLRKRKIINNYKKPSSSSLPIHDSRNTLRNIAYDRGQPDPRTQYYRGYEHAAGPVRIPQQNGRPALPPHHQATPPNTDYYDPRPLHNNVHTLDRRLPSDRQPTERPLYGDMYTTNNGVGGGGGGGGNRARVPHGYEPIYDNGYDKPKGQRSVESHYESPYAGEPPSRSPAIGLGATSAFWNYNKTQSTSPYPEKPPSAQSYYSQHSTANEPPTHLSNGHSEDMVTSLYGSHAPLRHKPQRSQPSTLYKGYVPPSMGHHPPPPQHQHPHQQQQTHHPHQQPHQQPHHFYDEQSDISKPAHV